jgi:hypothetical protein
MREVLISDGIFVKALIVLNKIVQWGIHFVKPHLLWAKIMKAKYQLLLVA